MATASWLQATCSLVYRERRAKGRQREREREREKGRLSFALQAKFSLLVDKCHKKSNTVTELTLLASVYAQPDILFLCAIQHHCCPKSIKSTLMSRPVTPVTRSFISISEDTVGYPDASATHNVQLLEEAPYSSIWVLIHGRK